MKAIHKYKEAAKRGNKEAQRRIAQSMGYEFSIYDMPKMIELMARAGIQIPGVDYSNAGTTDFVEDYENKSSVADTTTISL